METATILLLAALILTTAADVITTLRGIERGAVEGNPIVVWIVGTTPDLGDLLAVKALLIPLSLISTWLWGEVGFQMFASVLILGQGFVSVLNARK